MKNRFFSVYIILCFSIAMLLEMMTGGSGPGFSPSWVLVFLLLFTVHYPETFNIGWAWLLGLFVDALVGDPLGKNALIFTLMTFTIHFSLGGMAGTNTLGKLFLIMLFVSIYEFILIVFTVNSLALWHVWLPGILASAVSSALLWFALSLFVGRQRSPRR